MPGQQTKPQESRAPSGVKDSTASSAPSWGNGEPGLYPGPLASLEPGPCPVTLQQQRSLSPQAVPLAATGWIGDVTVPGVLTRSVGARQRAGCAVRDGSLEVASCRAGRVWEEEEAGVMVWTGRRGGGLQGLGRPPDL